MKIKILLYFISSLIISGFFLVLIGINIFFSSNHLKLSQNIPTQKNKELTKIFALQTDDKNKVKKDSTELVRINIDEKKDSSYIIVLKGKKYNIVNLDESDIESIAQSISPEQLNEIKNTILSPSEADIRRHAYLYFLIQLKDVGAKSIFEVIKSDVPSFEFQNNPHSSDSIKKNFELSLRIAALEGLDNLAASNPKIGAYIQQLESGDQQVKANSNSILTYLTSISQAGIESKKPGKLHRALDAIMNENDTL